MPYREEFLAEEIRREGRGDAADLAECPSCEDKGRESVDEPIYRCDDCFGGFMECGTCCLERHGRVPLHRVKVSPQLSPGSFGLTSGSRNGPVLTLRKLR